MKLAVVVANPQGLIRHWSPEAAELFGHAAGDAIGKSLDVIVRPAGCANGTGPRSAARPRAAS